MILPVVAEQMRKVFFLQEPIRLQDLLNSAHSQTEKKAISFTTSVLLS